MTQRIIPIHSPNFIAESAVTGGLDWAMIFGNTNPLALEIGCGIGHFVLERAQQQPHINFLAIDIYNKGCLKTCRKIDEAGLVNVRVIRSEARYLMTNGLEPESLTAVYINCPDPWPKKRHRQRRLVDREFLLALGHYLVPGGDFYFSSDFVDYAKEVASLIRDLTGYCNRQSDDWVHNLPDYPVSKYMQRFLDLGQNIYYIHYQRDPAVSRSELSTQEFQRGFRADWKQALHD